MDSSSYSFRKLRETNGVTLYYTKPSAIHTSYETPEEVLHDYTMILDRLGNNKWSWIIDADGFELLSVFEMKSGMDFAKLLKGQHGENLQEIKIINPTLGIRMILKMVLSLFDEKMRKKIKVHSDRYYSLLEFI